jgi:hypothetical protein
LRVQALGLAQSVFGHRLYGWRGFAEMELYRSGPGETGPGEGKLRVEPKRFLVRSDSGNDSIFVCLPKLRVTSQISLVSGRVSSRLFRDSLFFRAG